MQARLAHPSVPSNSTEHPDSGKALEPTAHPSVYFNSFEHRIQSHPDDLVLQNSVRGGAYEDVFDKVSWPRILNCAPDVACLT
jgi:hypothetical protein